MRAVLNDMNLRQRTSTPFEWPGGLARIVVSGKFLTGNGVGTSVQVNVATRRGDGVHDGGRHVRTFTTPGDYREHLPPGTITLHAAGPELPWSVDIELSDPNSERPQKPPTLEQRVKAIENAITSTQVQ